uniref:TATA-box-binding protein n=1 Tax=Meloidogyne incognita TaxID=6306 RepID=A0A914M4D2_MELIC
MRIAPPSWLCRHISYNPEFFPGMCLRIKELRSVIILFTSGKCIITGARTEDEIYNVQNKVYNSILMFLKI